VTERVLQGPFLTRAQASRRAGVPGRILVHRPDLLSISSRWLQEAYFAFQFDDHGVRPDVGSAVLHLKGRFSDIDIADWLVRANALLYGAAPLEILDGHAMDAVARVVAVSECEGPVAEDLWSEVLHPPDVGVAPVAVQGERPRAGSSSAQRPRPRVRGRSRSPVTAA
jgi:hypothetical protein